MKNRIARTIRATVGVASVALAAALIPAGSASASANSFPYPNCSYDAGGFYFQHNNGVLMPGAAACTDKYELTLQNDGNLVLYNSSGSAIWSSQTWGHTPGSAFMQSDGNFVLYDNNHNALWSTSTWGNSGAWFFFQPDGNLVVYTGGNQFDPSGPIWSTGTYGK
ncbi:hypothetical protein E6W39_28195 [Kitasatospora acidiphila]|uniref:Bulb-type lectin domain-containing protein n=1 Tax=Kitasatospora acidiphila TaxID=2567942 RepID=A0A540W8R7_9ACTN|nr:hypothetical protein [Kitasatospora acidiphila]TQF05406.1 hypothetical protein E6W39_28195 [Kitasatospora acidiphila]